MLYAEEKISSHVLKSGSFYKRPGLCVGQQSTDNPFILELMMPKNIGVNYDEKPFYRPH